MPWPPDRHRLFGMHNIAPSFSFPHRWAQDADFSYGWDVIQSLQQAAPYHLDSQGALTAIYGGDLLLKQGSPTTC